ncbi:hypothetical protein E2P81_ATG12006 [Venturia nashicola]|uniref:Uncharacterized protein n=1 Tax=Venturia nashicola TaxID=86259 RepID=A0A4Z1P6I8_9PEZI|nr:hypothetical protein E6O75_ATG11703 [Venturia nashicola]TLD24670.1 hypothetical protein E2P81_ATG12006 [Venturia nashicola]
MRFTILPILCLASSTLALPVESALKDIQIIERSLRSVSASLDKLSSELQAINPRMPSSEVQQRWPNVERVGHDLSNLLDRDAREIRMSPTINAFEASTLLQSLTRLSDATDRTVNEWISIRGALNQGDRKKVVDVLKHHQASSGAYADAILSRQQGATGLLTGPPGQLFGQRAKVSIQRALIAYQ